MYLGLISEKLDEWIKNNIFCVVHNIFHSLSSFFIFFLLFSNTQDAHSILVRPAADVVQSGKLEDVNHDVQLYSADDQVLDLSLASRSSPGSPACHFFARLSRRSSALLNCSSTHSLLLLSPANSDWEGRWSQSSSHRHATSTYALWEFTWKCWSCLSLVCSFVEY